MSVEELCLTWDDHHKTLIGVFEKLLENSSLVDCTIAAEGQYLKAHKVVLSACSPYFEMLFTQENEKNPIVVLKDVRFQDLKALIDFIYRGKIQIPGDRLGDFTAAAESLQIKGLGGGHKRNNSGRTERESSSLYNKEGCDSPISKKRMRQDFSEVNVKNVGDVSLTTLKSKSQSCETVSDLPSFSSTALPLASEAAFNATSQVFRTPKESTERNSSSFIESHTDCDSESFPEPMTEELLPETECVVEPKSEVYIEEISILVSDDEVVDDAALRSRNNEESTNSVYPSSLGGMKVSDNSFPLTTLAEQSNAGDCPSLIMPERSTCESFDTMRVRKRNPITLEKKYEVIISHERGSSVKDICTKYSMSSSTVCTILKNKEKYLNEVKDGQSMQSTRVRSREFDSIIPEMEMYLSAWICNQSQQSCIPIGYTAICARAIKIFETLKDQRGCACNETFVASRGWFDRFKKRAGLQQMEVQGERDSGSEGADAYRACTPPPNCEFR